MASSSPGRGLEWYVARRYMASRRKGRLFSFITWIALGGVTVGVSALVIAIGAMSGMQAPSTLRGEPSKRLLRSLVAGVPVRPRLQCALGLAPGDP